MVSNGGGFAPRTGLLRPRQARRHHHPDEHTVVLLRAPAPASGIQREPAGEGARSIPIAVGSDIGGLQGRLARSGFPGPQISPRLARYVARAGCANCDQMLAPEQSIRSERPGLRLLFFPFSLKHHQPPPLGLRPEEIARLTPS
eukprot:1286119-Pyramimonas_sp.AAC.1